MFKSEGVYANNTVTINWKGDFVYTDREKHNIQMYGSAHLKKYTKVFIFNTEALYFLGKI